MALGLTPEHSELAAAVRGWAQRHCPPEVVREAAESADSGAGRYRDALVSGLAEQGLFGLHLAESEGGQGFGLPELAVAVEELGRALVPGAFVPTVLASAVLARSANPPDGLLAKLADGSVELLAAGPEAVVAELVESCRAGPKSARVASVERHVAADEAISGFEARPTH